MLIKVCLTSISGNFAKDSKTSNGDNTTPESTFQVPVEKLNINMRMKSFLWDKM
ncbi:Hypothetical predicted protein, partial [Paramuricea clavata]